MTAAVWPRELRVHALVSTYIRSTPGLCCRERMPALVQDVMTTLRTASLLIVQINRFGRSVASSADAPPVYIPVASGLLSCRSAENYGVDVKDLTFHHSIVVRLLTPLYSLHGSPCASPTNQLLLCRTASTRSTGKQTIASRSSPSHEGRQSAQGQASRSRPCRA